MDSHAEFTVITVTFRKLRSSYFYVFERVERMLLNRIVNTERGMPDKSLE